MWATLQCAAGATLLVLGNLLSETTAATFAQLKYTSSPSQAFVGSFAGPLYSPGIADPTCSLLISPGLGTTTFIVVPNVTYTDTKCTDLAAIPFSDYTYLGVSNVKCIGPGEGYQFNYPANVVGAPPTVGGQYYCIKFKNHNNATEMTFTNGDGMDVQCPDTYSNATLIATDPGNNAGFVIYYALQGAALAPC